MSFIDDDISHCDISNNFHNKIATPEIIQN